MACFTLDEFTQIKALMFEMGCGDQFAAYIAKTKELGGTVAAASRELSALCPLHFSKLPPNPYGAHVATGALALFINRQIADGFLFFCFPQPAMETDAQILCAVFAAKFAHRYSLETPHWAVIDPLPLGNN